MGIETSKEYIASKEERRILKERRDELKKLISEAIKPQTSYMPLFIDKFYITDEMKVKIRNTWNGAICNKEVVEMMEKIAEKLKHKV